jgi:hypothetical protein
VWMRPARNRLDRWTWWSLPLFGEGGARVVTLDPGARTGRTFAALRRCAYPRSPVSVVAASRLLPTGIVPSVLVVDVVTRTSPAAVAIRSQELRYVRRSRHRSRRLSPDGHPGAVGGGRVQ